MTDIRLSVAITHAAFDPGRQGMLAQMLWSLGPSLEEIERELVDMRVITDRVGIGVWPVFRKAWLHGLKMGSSHHLVLPDDAIACRDIFTGIKRALAYVPDRPVVFYTGGPEGKAALDKGVSWIRCERVEIGCLGIVLPSRLIKDFLDWEPRHFRPEYKHSDVRLECWAYLTRNWIWASSPSLFEHIGENRSVLGHDGHPRHHATSFIGATNSALDIDWSLGADDPAVSRAKIRPDYLRHASAVRVS